MSQEAISNLKKLVNNLMSDHVKTFSLQTNEINELVQEIRNNDFNHLRDKLTSLKQLLNDEYNNMEHIKSEILDIILKIDNSCSYIKDTINPNSSKDELSYSQKEAQALLENLTELNKYGEYLSDMPHYVKNYPGFKSISNFGSSVKDFVQFIAGGKSTKNGWEEREDSSELDNVSVMNKATSLLELLSNEKEKFDFECETCENDIIKISTTCGKMIKELD